MSNFTSEDFDPEVHVDLDMHWFSTYDEVSEDFLNALGCECDKHGLNLELINTEEGAFYWSITSLSDYMASDEEG